MEVKRRLLLTAISAQLTPSKYATYAACFPLSNEDDEAPASRLIAGSAPQRVHRSAGRRELAKSKRENETTTHDSEQSSDSSGKVGMPHRYGIRRCTCEPLPNFYYAQCPPPYMVPSPPSSILLTFTYGKTAPRIRKFFSSWWLTDTFNIQLTDHALWETLHNPVYLTAR